jgi:hypothetical protein
LYSELVYPHKNHRISPALSGITLRWYKSTKIDKTKKPTETHVKIKNTPVLRSKPLIQAHSSGTALAPRN